MWIVENFWDWTDCAGHPENVISRDRLLDNVMLYWLPGAGASSARLYWESFNRRRMDEVPVPTGVTLFPRDLVRLPRRWIEQGGEVAAGHADAAQRWAELTIDRKRAVIDAVWSITLNPGERGGHGGTRFGPATVTVQPKARPEAV